jgi:hypothetical protein
VSGTSRAPIIHDGAITVTVTTELDRLFEARLPRVVYMHPDKMLPGTLYHYTNAAGLRGILMDRAMWATNFSFLNDPSEMRYGQELVVRMLRESQNHIEAGGTVSGVLQAISASFRKLPISEVYVCCFTKRRDDLNQWRAYGTATEARYCIGFDFEALDKIAAATLDATLSKIHYAEPKQHKRIKDVIKVTLDFVEAVKHLSQRDSRAVAEWAARRLADLLPRLKSPAYAAEEEWRVIRLIPPKDVSELCFDTRRGFVRPYVMFPLADGKYSPVRELLVLAPGREKSSVKAAAMLLGKAAIKNVRPEPSLVPFAE